MDRCRVVHPIQEEGAAFCLVPAAPPLSSARIRPGLDAPTMTFSKPAALLARKTALELWLPQPPLESLSLLNLPWLSSR